MAITIEVHPNEDPRLIIIPSPQTDITIQELVNAIRDWEDSDVGGSYEYLIDATGKQTLGAGLQVGITLQLNNAQLQFEPINTVHASGLATADDPNGKLLDDSLASFLSDGLHKGDIVFNYSNYSMGTLLEVVSDTRLRTSILYGGSRDDWRIGDTYQVYHTVEATITGGNLVAIDSNGDELQPLLQAANVAHTIESATSAAIVQGESSITEQDKTDIADAVADRDYEGGLSLEEMMRIVMAATAGATAGTGTSTVQFKSKDGLTVRIQSTFDAEGNRVITFLDGS